MALLRERREEFGIPDFEQAQHRDPELIEKLRALGYVDSGLSPGTGDVRLLGPEAVRLYSELQLLLTQERYAEAEVLARRSIEHNPQSPETWLSAGFASVGLGDLAAAEKRFRAAVDLSPERTQPLLNLANVQLKLGRLEEAEAGYQKVLEIDSEDFYALYNLGTLLAGRGRVEEATGYWRRFAALYPENRRTAGVRKKLARWDAEVPSP